MSFDKCSMVAYTSAAGNRTCWTRSKSPQITLVKIVYQTFFHSSSHFHLSSPYFHYFSLIFAWNIHDTHRHTLTAADLGPCGRQFFQQRCEPRASNLWRPTWVLDRSIFFLCLGWPLEVCFMKWDVKRHGHWQQMVQQPYTSSSWWLEPEVQTFTAVKSSIHHLPEIFPLGPLGSFWQVICSLAPAPPLYRVKHVSHAHAFLAEVLIPTIHPKKNQPCCGPNANSAVSLGSSYLQGQPPSGSIVMAINWLERSTYSAHLVVDQTLLHRSGHQDRMKMPLCGCNMKFSWPHYGCSWFAQESVKESVYISNSGTW